MTRYLLHWTGLTLAVFALMLGAALSVPRLQASSPPTCEMGVAFENDSDGLYWMQADGSGVVQVVDYDDYLPPGERRSVSAALSPDGVTAVVGYPALEDERGYHFALVNLVDGTTTPLMGDEIRNRVFFWSPDGARVAYMRAYSDEQVFMQDVRSGDTRLVADANAVTVQQTLAYGRFSSVDWSPDGEQLALTLFRETGITAAASVVFTVDAEADGVQWRLARSQRNPYGRAWSSTWSSNHTLFYGCQTGASFSERGGICAADLPRSLTVQVADLADNLLTVNTRIVNMDAHGDEMIFTLSDSSGRVFHMDTISGTITDLSAVSGFTGQSPRWQCRPQVTGK